MPAKRRFDKIDRTGRSAPAAKHVGLYRHLLLSKAWRRLSCNGRSLYVELAYRFNGENNGRVPMSVREAGAALNIAPNTSLKAFGELKATGFIKVGKVGSFSLKQRHATEWILTEYGLKGERPTKEYQRWQPPDQKTERGITS